MAAPFSESFAGVSLSILRRDRTERREAQVSVRLIPDGPVYVDTAGALPAVRRYVVHLPNATAYATLRGKVGTTGTLVDLVRGTATALLTTLEFADDSADGSVLATAEFLIL